MGVTRMHSRAFRFWPVVCAVLIAACAQPTAAPRPSTQSTGTSGAQAPAAEVQSTKTLRVVIRSEPGSVAGTILLPTGITTTTQRRLFNAGLALLDGDSKPRPYLAENLPTLNTDAWKVFPDGQMETTFHLRPNLTWHDGSPLTADDFVFAKEVYSSRNYGIANIAPYPFIEEVSAPDPRTVVIKWNRPYPDAAEMNEQTMTPLPRKVVEPLYERERENLPNQPFWTSEYIGSGPYRIENWQPGAYIEASSFAGHALGKPHINRLRITWSSDFNATLATLMSGENDMPADDSIRVEQGLVLENDWSARNAGKIQYRPNLPRFIQVQHRPEYANPQAVRDVRVRRALLHAIEKSQINASLFSGKGITSDSLVYPSLDYFAQVDRVVAKYPFDLRASEQIMTEAGFTKDGSGIYVAPTGGRVNLEIRNIQSAQNDAERSIIADGWRRAGFEVEENVFTPVQTQDGQVLGTFRGLSVTSAAAQHEGLNLRDYKTESISRPETRWLGQNRGGWSNADYDRAAAAFETTLDPPARQQTVADAAKALTTDLGIIPLHFNPGVLAFAGGIQGPLIRASDAELSWNIYEWTFN